MNQYRLKPFFLTFMALCFALVTGAVAAYGQSTTASGTVLDQYGDPLMGVTVKVNERNGVGTITDLDGNFSLKVNPSETLSFSYVGFKTLTLSVAELKANPLVRMFEDQELLEEVVVIGYGSVKKEDLTGSVTAIGNKDFKKGLIQTPDQLIAGKVAGVQIVSGGGSPGAGSKIRIRGGASLNASNDPLIVIDGVPLENGNVPGSPSPLSAINPNDIESMNILKDASATAIYGSRASNGVIIITTKKGTLGQKLQVSASTRFSVSTPKSYVDVLTGDEVRALVKAHGDQKFISLLGDANTDWQKEIYQIGLGTDTNLSIAGSTSWLPYRVSIGYYDEKGILKTDRMNRLSGDLSLNPRFFNNDLKIDLNLKATRTNNRFADKGAISAAVQMDPTHPVLRQGEPVKGTLEAGLAPLDQTYHYLTGKDDAGHVIPLPLAPKNPLSLLNDKEDRGSVGRLIGNATIAYTLPFFRDLTANLNLAYDYTHAEGTIYIPATSPISYTNQQTGKGGLDNRYLQEKHNKLLDFYLNYRKEVASIHSTFDVMAGYSYQDWLTKESLFSEKTATGIEYNKPNFESNMPQNTLVSFYGRLNYTLFGRYLLTATVRADGSSRFAPANRWGVFPSFAFAWKMKEESFLKDVDALYDLKLRLGYGVTGQQDGIGNYSYLASYALSGNQSKYLFGNTWYNMYKPLAYDAEIKWEQTVTTNAGLDFGFLDGRLSGSVDYYHKDTRDLLNTIPIPAGSNFSNKVLTNIGQITNDGVEVSLNYIPVDTKDWTWDINYNVTYNKTRITKLNQTYDPDYLGVETGGIAGGTGNNVQMHSEGYAPNSFFLYRQVYDAEGKPVEGLFADLNGDGVINNYDKSHVGKPDPDVFMGLSTSLRFRGLTLSTSLRASIGNYVYDNVSSDRGTYASVEDKLGWLNNGARDILSTRFERSHYLSDYYVKDASFLKMDNLSLSYDFGRVWNGAVAVNLGATVQNVFTLTKYKGVDPEIGNGIDYQFYPVPRVFSVNLGLTF